jgi:hypothetical protein
MYPTEVTRMLDKLEKEGRFPPLDEVNLSELDKEIADCCLHPEQGKTWEETKQELNALRIQR